MEDSKEYIEKSKNAATYISIVEAANEIGITTTSLYKIVNHEDPSKKLEPVNRGTHRGDGGYRFRLSDVLEFKRNYVKKDLTSTEAAKRLGRSTTFVHKLIRDGVLPHYEADYRGKRTFFIKEADLEKYIQENPNAGKVETIYDKRKGVFLFQPFVKGDQLARVMELKRVNNRKIEAWLKTIDGRRLSYDTALNEGWTPLMEINERKLINGYGYARFEFPAAKSPDSVIYPIIEELYKQAGPANMKITQESEIISVEVRKCVLSGVMPDTHPDLIVKLERFLKSGQIIPKYDGTLIDTGIMPVTIYLTEDKKNRLLKKAEERDMTLQEYMEECLSFNN
ncbi:helix-turn-helix domain-containing protein [Paenibacillus ihuae]|uniref:helix-turn-helix domain-containing protein n=1 Tax=Paenibacillus ihuae TaxID=1232431 RepID=UPI0006D562A8|nr:helix-turn-helix domain-containing protein [Paenibacillus ihuae]